MSQDSVGTGIQRPPPSARIGRRGVLRGAAGAAVLAVASVVGWRALSRASGPGGELRGPPPGPAQPEDWDVPDGHFYTQTAPPGAPPGTGYLVSDADGILFWRDYQALGGPALLGYPISARYEADGVSYQAMQTALLRWNAAAGAAEVEPVLATLAGRGLDDWLAAQGIPRSSPLLRADPHLPAEARLAWLTQPTLRDAYHGLSAAAGQHPLGLPMGEPERVGPTLTQRFDRGALQLWLDETPAAPEAPAAPAPGAVGLVHVGDLLKAAGLIPAAALAPQPAPAPRPAARAPAMAGAPVPPVPVAAVAAPAAAIASGKYVTVALGQQWWYAYQDGALVFDGPVTTGRPELPTPQGRFSVLSKHSPFTFVSPWPPGNRFWYPPSPCSFALRITGNGVFLHDAPWRPAYGPGTNLPHVTPDGTARTGSHGCINMPYEAARWLYGWAPVGTTVDVVA